MGREVQNLSLYSVGLVLLCRFPHTLTTPVYSYSRQSALCSHGGAQSSSILFLSSCFLFKSFTWSLRSLVAISILLLSDCCKSVVSSLSAFLSLSACPGCPLLSQQSYPIPPACFVTTHSLTVVCCSKPRHIQITSTVDCRAISPSLVELIPVDCSDIATRSEDKVRHNC